MRMRPPGDFYLNPGRPGQQIRCPNRSPAREGANMPVYLSERDISSETEGLESVLIVPCRFCPAASMAVRTGTPYIELFRRWLKTDAYERYLRDLRGRFEDRGIRTTVFRSRFIHQFVLCMWSRRRRRKLADRARRFDAVVVTGCEAAGQTVKNALRATPCRVVQALKSEGIMSIQPKLRPPCNLELELESVTSIP
jgi:hypothetical protein